MAAPKGMRRADGRRPFFFFRVIRVLLFFSLFVVSPSIGCTDEHLPPPGPPSRELPPQEEPLPTETSGLSCASSELLCSETPCSVTLPYGDHELVFVGLRDRDRHRRPRLSLDRRGLAVSARNGSVPPYPETKAMALGGVGSSFGGLLVLGLT